MLIYHLSRILLSSPLELSIYVYICIHIIYILYQNRQFSLPNYCVNEKKSKLNYFLHGSDAICISIFSAGRKTFSFFKQPLATRHKHVICQLTLVYQDTLVHMFVFHAPLAPMCATTLTTQQPFVAATTLPPTRTAAVTVSGNKKLQELFYL